MPPTSFAPMPRSPAMASPGADITPPRNYVDRLDKSHVRVVETFNVLTAAVPRNKRRDFQSRHHLDTASPARWPFEALMTACAEFGVAPLLGVGGTDFALKELGLKPGSFSSIKPLVEQEAILAATGLMAEVQGETEGETPVEEAIDDFASEELDIKSDAFDANWFEDFFGLGESAPPSSTRGASTTTASRDKPAASGVFVTPQLDDHFVMGEPTKKLLRTLEALSRKEILNVALTGPTGTGKTSLPEWFAARTSRPFFIFDTPTIREPKEALGYKDLKVDPDTGATSIVWQKSGLIKALETPNCVVVLDEVTRVHGSYMNALLALLDHRKRVWLDEIQDSVQIADGVIIFFTANIGSSYTGTWTWDAAFENRIDFRIDIDYLSPADEAGVLQRKTGLDAAVAKSFAEIAQIIRARAQDPADSLSKAVSTRQLLSASKAVVSGLSPSEALEFTIVPTYSAEGASESDRAHVLQIIQGKLAGPSGRGRAR